LKSPGLRKKQEIAGTYKSLEVFSERGPRRIRFMGGLITAKDTKNTKGEEEGDWGDVGVVPIET
jgi:hypothetical protein